MDFICIDKKDAADFCIEILQELFKDADFKRETLARWGVKKAVPVIEWEELPSEEIKVGDFVKTIKPNEYSKIGDVDKVTNINLYPDGDCFICIKNNKHGMKHPARGNFNIFVKVIRK